MGTPWVADAGGLLPPGVRPLRTGDPARIGGHTLVGRLGSGGMGVVYLGRDPLGGLVAVKSAHARTADDELPRRFAAEAACLRRVPEGCTTRLISDGTRHVPPYIVTEYLEGRSLSHVVDVAGPLPPEQVRAVATGVLRALAAIHGAGLIHRDLKPPNIVLTVAGPRVIDFGIAQEIGASGGLTMPGIVVGSPGWIPPERLTRCLAGPASDVFGWGCLVVYARTGNNPFGRGDAGEMARRVLEEPPDLDGVEEPLRGLVTEALAKDPADRPSAGELLARLSDGEGRLVAGHRVPEAPVTGEHSRADGDPAATPVANVSSAADASATDASAADASATDASAPDASATDASADGAPPEAEPVRGEPAQKEPAEGESARSAQAEAGRDVAGPGVRSRRRAAAGVAALVAAALAGLIVTTVADRDWRRTPAPAAPPVSPPHERVTTGAAHPAPVVSPPPARRSAPAGRPSHRPAATASSGTSSRAPVDVPTLAPPTIPDVLENGKGKGKGRSGDGADDSGPVVDPSGLPPSSRR